MYRSSVQWIILLSVIMIPIIVAMPKKTKGTDNKSSKNKSSKTSQLHRLKRGSTEEIADESQNEEYASENQTSEENMKNNDKGYRFIPHYNSEAADADATTTTTTMTATTTTSTTIKSATKAKSTTTSKTTTTTKTTKGTTTTIAAAKMASKNRSGGCQDLKKQLEIRELQLEIEKKKNKKLRQKLKEAKSSCKALKSVVMKAMPAQECQRKECKKCETTTASTVRPTTNVVTLEPIKTFKCIKQCQTGCQQRPTTEKRCVRACGPTGCDNKVPYARTKRNAGFTNWNNPLEQPKIWPGGCIAYGSICGGSVQAACCPGSMCKDVAVKRKKRSASYSYNQLVQTIESHSPRIWPGGCIAYNSVCGGSFGGKCCPGSKCKNLAGGSKCVRDCVGCIQRPTAPTCIGHGSVCEPSKVEQCCPGSKCTEVTFDTSEGRVISNPDQGEFSPESKLPTDLVTRPINIDVN